MKLGIYGGSFDPVHIAHLVIANDAVKQLGLDKLLIIPCAEPPHKSLTNYTNSQHRLEMVKLAVAQNPAIEVSDIEIKAGGVSFTINTVEKIRSIYQLPKNDLFLIIGADNFKGFDNWRNPKNIVELCQLVVAGRPGTDQKEYQQKYLHDVIFLDTPLLEISSSDIRARIKKGESIKYLVPDVVGDYINTLELYI